MHAASASADRQASAGQVDAARLPLVLLPGTLCDARLFAPLLARLVDRPVQVLPLTGASTAETASAVLATAPARFALLGFSLGGIVALEVAAQARERVAGLALIGANARALAAGADDPRLAAWRAEGNLGAHVRERLWPSYVAAESRGDIRLQREIVAMAEHGGAATLAGQLDIMRNRVDSRARLPALTMPALVLAGEEDVLCPPPVQHEMADGLADATLALIPGAGHFVPLEQPDATAAHVAEWLVRVDRRASAS